MAYFANGTEGFVFEHECGSCRLGQLPCPVAWVQLEYNYKQIDNPTLRDAIRSLVSDDGTCQMKACILTGEEPT